MNKAEENILNQKADFNRYNNSKIYKVINTVDDTFYIGSTCTQLSKRINGHKKANKQDRSKENKFYKHLNEIGLDRVRIILIAEFYLENKEQILREENYYISIYRHDPSCINSIRAVVTNDEINADERERRRINIEL